MEKKGVKLMSNPITNNNILYVIKELNKLHTRNKSNFFTLVGKLQTTEDDIQANSNIVPFGKCKLKT